MIASYCLQLKSIMIRKYSLTLYKTEGLDMNTIELKKSFHNLIDSIDNANLLENFYDLIKKRTSSKDGQLWNSLSKKEREELLLAFEESEDPANLKSHEEMKKKNEKWL